MHRTFALLLFACFVSSARADPFDDWCKTVRLPSSVAICSDPELRALTIERQDAYSEAKAKLSPDQQKALLDDQNGWVKSYPLACGLAQDTAPALPLAPAVKDCMARAGRARIVYLRTYGGLSATGSAGASVPALPSVPKPQPGIVPEVTELSPSVPNQPPPAAQAQQVPAWFYGTPAYYAWLSAMQHAQPGQFPTQIPQQPMPAHDPVLWCYELGRPMPTSVCKQAVAQKQADDQERLRQQEEQDRIAALDRQREQEQETADRLKKITAEGDHPTETPTGFPIEKDAVIAKLDKISWIDALKAIDYFVTIAHLNSLKCSSVSAFRPMIFAKGFVLMCDQYSFTYDMQDHGRGWEVTAE